MTPTHTPAVGTVKSNDPFIRPTNQPHLATDQASTDLSGTDHTTSQRKLTNKSPGLDKTKQPSTSDLPGTTRTVSRTQSTSKSSKDTPSTDRPSVLTGTDSPAFHQVSSKSSSAPARKQSTSDSEFFDRPPVDIFVEEGELSDQDPDVTVADPDQTLSEEQTYKETMRGIRSFIMWTHIPDVDTATSTSVYNSFAGPQTQSAGKESVRMPTDELLCRKMSKLK